MSTSTLGPTCPAELLVSLEDLLEQQRLHCTELGHLTRALAEECPYPVTQAGIVHAVDMVRSLMPAGLPLSSEELAAVSKYWSELPLASGAPDALSHLGTCYPVLFALMRIDRRLHEESAEVRSQVSGTLLDLARWKDESGAHFSPSAYYHDVLSIRDALTNFIKGIRLDYPAHSTTSEIKQSLEVQVSAAYVAQSSTADKETDASVLKIRALHALLSEARTVGVPFFTHSARAGRGAIRTVDVVNPDDGEATLPGDTGYNVLVTTAGRNNSGDVDDDPATVYLQRRSGPRGSRATAGDDLHNHRTVHEAMESANAHSLTDLAKLPLVTIRQFFCHVIDDSGLLYAGCWILVTTGLKPGRLAALVSEERSREVSFRGTHLDTRSGILTFDVEGDAPDRGADSPEKTVVVVGLAYEINKLISRANVRNPFRDIEKRIDTESFTFKQHHAGIRPTAVKLTRSFRTLFAPLLPGDCLRATLPGNIPTDFRAQAAYYSSDNRALNIAYSQATYQFAKRLLDGRCSPRLQKILTKLTYDTRDYAGTLGSRNTVDTRTLANDLHLIAGKADALQSQIMSAPFLGTLETHVQLQNLQSANLYVMQAIFHAFRPIANVAILDPANVRFGAWAKDKNSSVFSERRLTMFAEIENDQITQCHLMDVVLQAAARMENVRVQIEGGAIERNLALIARLRYPRHGTTPTMCIGTMTADDFKGLMTEHQIPFELPDNFGRQWLAQQQEGVIPQAALDQILGHTRGAHDILARYSSASLHGQQRLLDKLVMECLKRLPFRVINTEI